jgi:hypothetical protein
VNYAISSNTFISTLDTFTSSGGSTITLSATPASKNLTLLYINGAYQNKDQYNLSGSTITFTTAPQSGDLIEVTSYTANTIGLYYTSTPLNTAITDDTTTATTHYPLLSIITSGSLTVANTSSSKLTYIPSTGTLSSTVVTASSDERLKSNIETIVTPIGIIQLMRGVSFTRNDSGKKDYGVIAQEIEKVLPEIVHTDESGMKSVSYNSIIGFLIEAVKDLQDQLDELKQKIK